MLAQTARLIVSVMAFLIVAASFSEGQTPKDPHRPACANAHCRTIQSFLKRHYCGESPFGNGPDEGCDPRSPKDFASHVKVKADFDCRLDQTKGNVCHQHSEPAAGVRDVVLREMHGLGLPSQRDKNVLFRVWESASGWLLAEGDYNVVSHTSLVLCQVLLVIDQNASVLRKVRYQTTDADVPNVTTWSPIDLADVKGDGHVDVILRGDAYEDHWFEVWDVGNGKTTRIFSGLGYYL